MEIVDLDKTGLAARAAAEGEMALGGGNTVLAKQKYREAAVALTKRIPNLRRQSDKDMARFLAASQYYRGGDYQAAKRLCGKIQAKLLPPSIKPLYAKFLRDLKERSSPDYAKRLRVTLASYNQKKEYRKILEELQLHPYVLDPDAISFLRAVCCENLGEFRAAAKFYGDVLHGGSAPPEAVFTTVAFPLTMPNEGRLAEAWKYAEHLLQEIQHPVISITASLLRYHQAVIAANDGEREFLTREQIHYLDRASSQYQMLPSNYQRNQDLRDYLTLCLEAAAFGLLGIGEKDESLIICDKAIVLNPNSCSAWTVRGIITYPTEQALDDFREGLRLGDPSYYASYFFAHKALVNRQFAEAKVQCEKALRLMPSQEVAAQLYEWIAITERFLGGSLSIVQELFQKALALSPDNARIRFNWDLHLQTNSASVAEPKFDWNPLKINVTTRGYLNRREELLIEKRYTARSPDREFALVGQ